jgi:hypothetical protein
MCDNYENNSCDDMFINKLYKYGNMCRKYLSDSIEILYINDMITYIEVYNPTSIESFFSLCDKERLITWRKLLVKVTSYDILPHFLSDAKYLISIFDSFISS